MIKQIPKIIYNKDGILLTDILLLMTSFSMGFCCFINNKNILLGIINDGDIRRILTCDPDKKKLNFKDINIDYIYIDNLKLQVSIIKEKFRTSIKYIPVIDQSKHLKGIVDLLKL